MNNLELYMFWTQHADAVGAAVIVAALAVLVLFLVIRRYEALARAQRRVYRDRLRAERVEHRKHCRQLFDGRPGSFDQHATRALVQARSRLADAYVFGQTVADAPSPFAPVFYEGGTR